MELSDYIKKTLEEVRAGLEASGAGGDYGRDIEVDVEVGTRLESGEGKESIVAEKIPQRMVGKVKFRAKLSIPGEKPDPMAMPPRRRGGPTTTTNAE